MPREWITKQLASINVFDDEATANAFASKARTTLLLTIDVRVQPDQETGRWIVSQQLKYVTTEEERSYAVPELPQ